MKLIKLIRPLFFVALALHGLLLFVPLGSETELVEEDVELTELEPVQPSGLPPVAGQLPVADPNAAARTAPAAGTTSQRATASASTARTASARGTAQSRTAQSSRVAASPTPTANSRRPTRRDRVTPTPTGDASLSQQESSSSSETTNRQSSNQSSTNQSSSSSETAHTQSEEPTIRLNTRNADDSDTPSESTAAEGEGSSRNRFERLLANATGQVTPALRSFVSGFRYDATLVSPENTRQRIESWKSMLQTQASVGRVLTADPVVLEDHVDIRYPLRAVSNEKVRSLQVCLDRPPEDPTIGLQFNSQGQLASDPVALHSTGFKSLDKEISMWVATSDQLPSDRRSKAYMVEATIDYDAQDCLNLDDVIGSSPAADE